MNLVIMQPYLFPYVGYFQLLVAADRFVIYDDVNFIKGGWINRNRILMQGKPHLFTIPLEAPSPNRKINDIQLGNKFDWRSKLLQTIAQSYKRASNFTAAYDLISKILSEPTLSITDLVYVSLREIVAYLELPVQLIPSSSIYNNSQLRSEERVLDICKKENASCYINAMGGRELYSDSTFKGQGIELYFLQPDLVPYQQVGQVTDFTPGLSIIDVLMNNSAAEANRLLANYTLIK